jgi:hypothetical protein
MTEGGVPATLSASGINRGGNTATERRGYRKRAL